MKVFNKVYISWLIYFRLQPGAELFGRSYLEPRGTFRIPWVFMFWAGIYNSIYEPIFHINKYLNIYSYLTSNIYIPYTKVISKIYPI